MEFRFDIKPLFPQPIVKVTSNLLPHTFKGDRRQALDTTSKMSEIIDRLGELSAVSQKLSKAVTTSQRLRMSDNQRIYIFADVDAGHNGSVIGLLKVGTKSLYLFDQVGESKKVDDAPCILDFYIHESRQRAGLGRDLFETMLAEEEWTPIQLSIDRPSEKLLGFMKKHYALEKTIPQANNFVVYEGFFGPASNAAEPNQNTNGLHIKNSPNTALFGAHYLGDDNKKRIRQLDCSSPSSQITQISPVGRYAAPRPTCSMAEKMKTASEISLTPSQAELQKQNPEKRNPLDALSRTSYRNQSTEKRSGLQPISDDYYSSVKNSFATTAHPRHSGLTQEQAKYQRHQQMTTNPVETTPMAQVHQHPQESVNQHYNAQQSHQNPQGNVNQQYHTPHQAHPNPQYQTQQQMNSSTPPPDMTNCKNATSFGDNNIIHSNSKPASGESSSVTSLKSDNATESTDIEKISEALHKPDSSDETTNNIDVPVEQHKLFLDLHSAVETESEVAAAAAAQPPASGEGNLTEDTPISGSAAGSGSFSKDATTSDNFMSIKKPTPFQLSKQHTGLKNISFNVGMAVTPTKKMEFDQEQTEEFGVVKINRPPGKLSSPQQPGGDNIDAVSTVSSGEGFTDQGYYDLKFYHNKLW